MQCPHCNSKNITLSQDYPKFNINFCGNCNKTSLEKLNPNVGQGTKIWHPELSNIDPTAKIGRDCTIHSHVWIGADVEIGNNCKIQAFCFIPSGVKIGNDVFLGPRVTFTNDKYPPSHGKGWTKTWVRDGASIGAGATILPGLIIHDNARVGAGSVVTKDIPSGVTVCGNPAKIHNKNEKKPET